MAYKTVIPTPAVLPTQVGIQDGIDKDRHNTNRAFLASRLRGKDGRKGGRDGWPGR